MREIPRALTEAERELYFAVERGDLLETACVLRQAREPLPRDLAAACLTKGLFACPELFSKLLEWCPEREYAGEIFVKSWPWRSPTDATDWKLQGTLVTLAAALNKQRHLEMLLARGMDANSASLAAGAALLTLRDGSVCGYGEGHGFPFPGKDAGLDSGLRVVEPNHYGGFVPCFGLYGMTPLAAAVTFGAVECVELLLEQPGLWLTESLSVSAALLLPFRDWNDNYQKACRLVREYRMEEGGTRGLTLWAAAQNCTARQLKEELARYPYTEEELALAARSVSLEQQYDGLYGKQGETDRAERVWRKLILLESICPAAVHVPEVSRQLLKFVLGDNPVWHREIYLPLVARAAQGTADISLAGKTLESAEQVWVKTVLQELGRYGRCVMERDAVPFGLNVKKLRLLLKYVEFLPPKCRKGISGLVCALLYSGDLRLIQTALKQGLLPGEVSTEQLLRFLKEISINPSVRAMLLCNKREPQSVPKLPALPEMTRNWPGFCRWFQEETDILGTSKTQWREQLLQPGCPEELERYYVLLERVSTGFGIEPSEFPMTGAEHSMRFGTDSHPMVMCMLGRKNTALASLQGIIGHIDVDSVWLQRDDEKDAEMLLTPLCAAALSGQTELVRALLERGLDAEECNRNRPCCVDCGQMLPLTPLMAALLGGHWDTVRLLAEYGASCDLQEPILQELQRAWWARSAEQDWRKNLPDLISEDHVLRKRV